ncbi:MAG: hypothetical protein RIM84_12955 [Alphaproteobacteria bacterium]
MTVVASYEDVFGQRCVDIIERADGCFALKEFRRDPEDGGGWTLVRDHGPRTYSGRAEAMAAAIRLAPWLAV